MYTKQSGKSRKADRMLSLGFLAPSPLLLVDRLPVRTLIWGGERGIRNWQEGSTK